MTRMSSFFTPAAWQASTMRLVSRSLLPGKPGGGPGGSSPPAAWGHLSGMATIRSHGTTLAEHATRLASFDKKAMNRRMPRRSYHGKAVYSGMERSSLSSADLRGQG